MEYREYLDVIQTEVGGRYDISALFHESSLLNEVTTDLAAPVSSIDVDLVAGIDALGFVLGTGVALDSASASSRFGKAGNFQSVRGDGCRRR